MVILVVLSEDSYWLDALLSAWLARIIHECRREVFETGARRGFSQVRSTQAYVQSVEEAARKKPCRARGSDEPIMNSPG